MGFSKRLPESASRRSVRSRGFRPAPERLETRALLTAIDLVNIAGPASGSTGPGPYGVLNLNSNSNSGSGYSIVDVGDVLGNGYDSYLIGAPSITSATGRPTLGQGAGNAYLVFGSQSANAQTIQNWLTLSSNQRIGDLNVLNSTTQYNPFNLSVQTFPFAGIHFVNSAGGELGASVAAAGDVNGDGYKDFMLGAPGANGAYLVYGSPQLANTANQTVNLDSTSALNPGVNVVTFTNLNQPGAQTGYSLAPVLAPGSNSSQFIAIGAPSASFNGLSGNGAVYLISSSALRPATTQTINLSTVGQQTSTSISGVIFTGNASADRLGNSVAYGGDFNADGFGDMLLGATHGAAGAGSAYLIYGSSNLLSQGLLNNGSYSISVGRVITSSQNTIPGAEFDGIASGDLTGFALAATPDFNGDNINDILIGSPGWTSSTGRANVIMGQQASLSSASLIAGQYNLSSLPSSIANVDFDGQSTGNLAGWSLTAIGKMNTTLNPIAIGAPGFNASQGQVYAIPGNPSLSGVYNLSNTQGSQIQGIPISLSLPKNARFLGSSLSGNVFLAAPNTVDGDNLGDLIIGAAGYNGTATGGGGAFVIEGQFLGLTNPVFQGITSAIGINKATPPFTISVTATSMTIYIESTSSNTPGFQPYNDIDPTTIKVNGVALPDPTTWTNAGDVDGDGIDDGAFTIPLSSLGLSVGTATITVTAKTLASSNLPNQVYQGSAQVTVQSGGGGGGGGTPTANFGYGPQFQNFNAAAPVYGERMLPSINTLNRALWKPLPTYGVYRQFLSPSNFRARTANYLHPVTSKHAKAHSTPTLPASVFTRSKFHTGVHFGPILHKVPAIGAGQNYSSLPLGTR